MERFFCALRSSIFLAYMAISVVPWATVVLIVSIFTRGDRIHATYDEHAKILRAILARSFLYWHQMATDKATDEIDAEWDSCRCHGAGCKLCNED